MSNKERKKYLNTDNVYDTVAKNKANIQYLLNLYDSGALGGGGSPLPSGDIESLKYYATANDFVTANVGKYGIIGYTNGVKLGDHEILLNEASGVQTFKTWVAFVEYIDNKLAPIIKDITDIKLELSNYVKHGDLPLLISFNLTPLIYLTPIPNSNNARYQFDFSNLDLSSLRTGDMVKFGFNDLNPPNKPITFMVPYENSPINPVTTFITWGGIQYSVNIIFFTDRLEIVLNSDVLPPDQSPDGTNVPLTLMELRGGTVTKDAYANKTLDNVVFDPFDAGKTIRVGNGGTGIQLVDTGDIAKPINVKFSDYGDVNTLRQLTKIGDFYNIETPSTSTKTQLVGVRIEIPNNTTKLYINGYKQHFSAGIWNIEYGLFSIARINGVWYVSKAASDKLTLEGYEINLGRRTGTGTTGTVNIMVPSGAKGQIIKGNNSTTFARIIDKSNNISQVITTGKPADFIAEMVHSFEHGYIPVLTFDDFLTNQKSVYPILGPVESTTPANIRAYSLNDTFNGKKDWALQPLGSQPEGKYTLYFEKEV